MQDESVIQARKSMIQDNSFIQAIRLPVNGSPWAVVYIGISHGGAVPLVFMTGMHWLVQFLCCIAVLVHGVHALGRYTRFFNHAMPRELLLTPAGEWWLRDADGHSHRARLGPDAFISPLFMVLHFQCGDGDRRVFIREDRQNAAMLRRLRVRLLHSTS